MYEYKATVIRIVDADTLKLDVDLGFRVHAQLTFRLARISAPELNSIGGLKARQFVIDRLAEAQALKVESRRSEKYGRWLCELFYQPRLQPRVWINLNDDLLAAGLAVRYFVR